METTMVCWVYMHVRKISQHAIIGDWARSRYCSRNTPRAGCPDSNKQRNLACALHYLHVGMSLNPKPSTLQKPSSDTSHKRGCAAESRQATMTSCADAFLEAHNAYAVEARRSRLAGTDCIGKRNSKITLTHVINIRVSCCGCVCRCSFCTSAEALEPHSS